MLALVTGGARNGKSSFALKLAEKLEGKNLFTLAGIEIRY